MAQHETTKDELENILVSKSQTIGWTPPKCVHLVFESPSKYMHIVYDNNGKFYLIACVHGTQMKYIPYDVHVPWRVILYSFLHTYQTI